MNILGQETLCLGGVGLGHGLLGWVGLGGLLGEQEGVEFAVELLG
jgi:hypothetical protein